MQKLVVFNLTLICLMGCTSSQESRQITNSDKSIPAISEEAIPGPTNTSSEVKKVKVAKPGIDPMKVANGIVDVWVDGRLETDLLDKENPVHVLVDDAIETSAEHLDTERNYENRTETSK